jgi:hypothetical protein
MSNIFKAEQEKEIYRSFIRKKFKRIVEHIVFDKLKCLNKHK